MQWIAGAYCCGVIIASQMPLLSQQLRFGLLLAVMLAVGCCKLNFRLAITAAGLLLGIIHLQHIAAMDHALAERLLSYSTLEIDRAVITEMPDCDRFSCRYVIRLIETADQGLEGSRVQIRHRLSSSPYTGDTADTPSAIELPQLGQHWRMSLSPRPNQGMANPVGHDRERYLFARRIHATAHVDLISAERLAESGTDPIGSIRLLLSESLQHWISDRDAAAVIRALLVGDQRDISPALWQRFRQTGTLHLMAISGLHIGLVAGLGWLLARALYRCSCQARTVARQRLGMIIALGFALLYAGLAGFSMPTQRALFMLIVVAAALSVNRATRPHVLVICSMTAVLLYDPRQVLLSGFWYSFTAVAALLYAFHANLHWSRKRSRFLIAQLVILLGLLPLSLHSGQAASWSAPWINLLVIPLMGILLMPLMFVGLLLALLVSLVDVSGDLASMLMLPASQLTTVLLHFLALMAEIASAPVRIAATELNVVLLCVAAVLLLGPAVLMCRLTGLAVALITLLPKGQIQPAELDLQVLDVGQGLSVVIRTRNSIGIYDFGASSPAWQKTDGTDLWSMGSMVINPYLDSVTRRTRLDYLIVSHLDNDHAGGLSAVQQKFQSRRQLVSGDLDSSSVDCRAGLSWHADGISFEILHPGPGLPYLGNNSSCVLLIDVDGQRVLIPGDIESVVESGLVRAYPDKITDLAVLLVPHHGSKTSSSREFTALTRPDIAVVSSRRDNRFGFPHQEVTGRYLAQNSRLLNTANCGAIHIRVDETGARILDAVRREQHRIWHRPGQLPCEFR